MRYRCMNKGLIALALGTFSLGIAEFGMMGILGDVANSMAVDVSTAGNLISAYSLGVAVGAPLLVFLHKYPLKNILLLLAGMILGGNAFAALAPEFHSLEIARFLSGLPHGAFFGLGAIVAQQLVKAGEGARAVAVMVGGMTVANLVGVPGATFISNIMNWRMTFATVALFGLLTLLAVSLWIPRLSALADTGLKGQFRFLRFPAPWLIYAGVFFGQASVYCYFSYVEPIMTEQAHFAVADMTWIMMVAGLGMVVGNAVSGKLADKYSAALVSGIISTMLVVVMILVYFCAGNKVMSVVLLFFATAGLFGIGGPLQYLIVKYAKGGEMLGGAGIQIAFNVSNAVSAAIGGIAIGQGLGIASPALVGVPCAVIGAVALFVLYQSSPDSPQE